MSTSRHSLRHVFRREDGFWCRTLLFPPYYYAPAAVERQVAYDSHNRRRLPFVHRKMHGPIVGACWRQREWGSLWLMWKLLASSPCLVGGVTPSTWQTVEEVWCHVEIYVGKKRFANNAVVALGWPNKKNEGSSCGVKPSKMRRRPRPMCPGIVSSTSRTWLDHRIHNNSRREQSGIYIAIITLLEPKAKSNMRVGAR